ncbi:MAG: hypothetical protein EOP04_01815 [Proteobacteria bacterium]|nr:MAG: hypothetical protein EOP04_01815 [Pseudomonadota bacterium]
MNVEMAQIMSESELQAFFASISRRHEHAKGEAARVLESRHDALIDAYFRYERTRVEKYYEGQKELRALTQAWQKKTCLTCGAPLRLVWGEWGSFWGCPNYRDGREHSRFGTDYEDNLDRKGENTVVRVSANWVTDIIRSEALPAFVKASDLLQFFLMHGLDDLRAKYDYKQTAETISGFTKGRAAALEEEVEIIRFLTPFFKRVRSQVGIRYRMAGDQERVAIVDLLASDDDKVTLIEIKRDELQLKEEQLALYRDLVSLLMKQGEDKRNLVCVFVVYNTPTIPSDWLKTPYVLYRDLVVATDKARISQLIERHQFKGI